MTYGSLGGLMVGISGSSGGGPIIAGLLLMGESLFDATATSSYVLAGMCSLGALVHAASKMVESVLRDPFDDRGGDWWLVCANHCRIP